MNTSSTIKIAGATVELVEKLNWGMQESIRAAMYGGLKVSKGLKDIGDMDNANIEFNADAITRSKYKAIEVCVKKITQDDGTEVKYSKDWLENLSVEDGDAIYAAVNKITNPEKK